MSRVKVPMPQSMLPSRPARDLLLHAEQDLRDAGQIRAAGLRYATAHMGALRAASAVLAARAQGHDRSDTPGRGGRRHRPLSVWQLLVVVAPEFEVWADRWQAGATKRAAAEAGIPRVVTSAEADDNVRAAGEFIAAVRAALEIGATP